MSREKHHVFGYGSLLDRADQSDTRGRICHLSGYTRLWNVAMDNRLTLPGYKYYLDAKTNERPEVFVVFLNIAPKKGAQVNGLVLPVDKSELASLDTRERNYSRVNISGDLTEPLDGTVWTYIGTDEARARYERGRREHRAVVSKEYHVRRQFRNFGADALAEFERLTEPTTCPVAELIRVQVPEGEGGGARTT